MANNTKRQTKRKVLITYEQNPAHKLKSFSKLQGRENKGHEMVEVAGDRLTQ